MFYLRLSLGGRVLKLLIIFPDGSRASAGRTQHFVGVGDGV